MLQNKKKVLILLVDDKLEDLRTLGCLLKEQGEVLFATTGKAGLFMANKHNPDLIIANMQLKDIPGVEFCALIQEQTDQPFSNIVMVSDDASEQCELNALDAGAIDFIARPYSTSLIQARVRNHIRQSREQHLLHLLANKDSLTEVYNRRYFEKQSQLELKRHYRQQHPIALALLDIDHFKAYNDAYGHLQGDVCLRDVAQALSSSSRRPGEFVTRYGGEEFAVVLPNTTLQDAKKYGEWICERILSLAIPHAHSATVPFISMSAGVVSVVPNAQTTLDSLISAADSALYLAKESGRNQFKAATLEHESIQEAI